MRCGHVGPEPGRAVALTDSVLKYDTGPTILIVDDDSAARDLLARWFHGAGWQVRLADTCAAALGIAAVATPDQGIVEQRLPDGSGIDLLPRLRALSPAMSGVVLTRYPSIAAAVRAIRVGFRDYLAKPVDWVHLAALFGISPPPSPLRAPANDIAGDDAARSLARIEWEHIQSVLFNCGGNVSAAARLLRVHRRSLQRKLRRIAPP
jgi:two-component system response regulator RegA